VNFLDLWLRTILFSVFFSLFTAYIIKLYLRRFSTKDDQRRQQILAESMGAGGPGRVGTLGRVAGPVVVEVHGAEARGVGVCLCPQLQVIYWWRVEGSNGHSLLLEGGGNVEEVARATVATIRLWGEQWTGAEKVEITVVGEVGDKGRSTLGDQVEDCQTKYGVQVVVGYGLGGDGGAGQLAGQLMSGRGTGQQDEGWYNNNLRIVGGQVYQIVDHTSKLSRHYFDL